MAATRILGELEPETISVWKELLIDLEFKYFRLALVDICKTKIDFYLGTNIPALIRETATDLKRKDIQKNNNNNSEEKFERYKQEAATPEEAKKFCEEARLKLKTTPILS